MISKHYRQIQIAQRVGLLVSPSRERIPDPSFALTAGREGRRCRVRKIPVLENVFICITG
jgi:hypothetical protein